MRSFIDKIVESGYKNIVFDLDGTLYDEYEFIEQAYLPVSCLLEERLHIEKSIIHDELCMEWLHYGSSGNIFQNVIGKYSDFIDDSLIHCCVERYREANLSLTLPARSRRLLDFLKSNGYRLFIISDGNSALQRRKMQVLRLNRWFQDCDILVSGDFGKCAQKPNTIMAQQLGLLGETKTQTIYVGDRVCDYDFAMNCGFDFCLMKNMNALEGNYYNGKI